MRKILFYTIALIIYVLFWTGSVLLINHSLWWSFLVFFIGIMILPSMVVVLLFKNAYTRISDIRGVNDKRTAFACGQTAYKFKRVLRICLYLSYVAFVVMLVISFKQYWRFVLITILIEMQIYTHVRILVSVFRKTVFGYARKPDYDDYFDIVKEFAESIGLKNFRLK